MKHWILRSSTALAALLAANAVLADVTPEDVWQSWQDQYAAMGQPVTAESVARDGDTLVVAGVKATTSSATNKTETLIPQLRMKDQGDGTVEVTMSGDMAITSTTTASEDVPAMKMDGTVKLPGMVTIASGSPDAVAYAYTMPEMDMVMNLSEDDKAPGTVSVKLGDAKGDYLIAGPADAKSMEGTFTAASAAMTLDVTDSTSTVKASFNAADLAATMKGNFVGVDMEKINEALAKGMAVDMSLTYGATSYDMDITDETGPGKITGGSEGGNFVMAMDKARMMLAHGSKNVAVTLSGMGIPFPEAKVTYAESGFNMTLPVGKSDAPADFAFLTKLVDLNVSDEIWGMLDPTAQLPHDAATLVIDTKGTMRVTADMLDDAAMAALGEAAPAELHSLDVTEVKLTFAGAELTGAGAFTFDNSDLTTFEGMPAPTGKMDLKLVGGNTLMDKLVAMGMLTEDDVMGARMMMAMFGSAVEGKDEITSTMEAKDKHIFVNGQQIQ